MDPVSLATAAISILAPALQQVGTHVAGRLSEQVGDAVRSLYERIKAKLAGDPEEAAVLEAVEAAPEDTHRLAKLQAVLAGVIAKDESFAASLERLVEAATAASPQFNVHDSGVVAGGNVTQEGMNVAGRDQTILLPPKEP